MRLHRIRGGSVFLVASLALAVLMFLPRFFNGGIAIGIALLAIAIVGAMDFLGTIKTPASAGEP